MNHKRNQENSTFFLNENVHNLHGENMTFKLILTDGQDLEI